MRHDTAGHAHHGGPDRWAVACRAAVVFTGLTAVLLHGLPTTDVPLELTVRAGSAGRAGRQPALHPYPGIDDVAMAYQRHFDATGQRFTGAYPVLPALRRRWTNRSDARDSVAVSVSLSGGTCLGTVLAEPLPVALAEVLAFEPLTVSVAPADAFKRIQGAEASALLDLVEPLRIPAVRRRQLNHAWAFADGRAESPGESLSRATIHDLGFVVPEPQHDLYDAAGRWVARVDHWWGGVGLAGEFDGMTKYSGAYTRPGEPPESVLVREKAREDAIRRTGSGVMRWVWKELRTVQVFEGLLDHHGVPRR
ncbi:hypothetical protein [Citricoccus sp.]|uniref:hypothetical protein n=1 Tax=Citricoccus sp. TaxID=1978372 RepID=UPI0028BD3105|nr:hypothetical protein [Citricoccus sp.]